MGYLQPGLGCRHFSAGFSVGKMSASDVGVDTDIWLML